MSEEFKTATLPGYEPEIGRWLWAMEEVRRQTLDSARGLDQKTLDWEGSAGTENAIGSLLYHIALVEMSWLFMDIYEGDFPANVDSLFPHDMATKGRLTAVLGISLEEHLKRLNDSRRIFLDALKGMSFDDWHRQCSPEDTPYEVTPAWVVFHLIEHEAGHTAQIRVLKMRASR